MRACLAVILTLFFAGSVAAECGARPSDSTFQIVMLCTAEKPCAAGKPIPFEIRTDTSCTGFGSDRCAPYTIDSCDRLRWLFNYGSSNAAAVAVNGSNRVEYTLPASQAGLLNVAVFLGNDRGDTYVVAYTRLLPWDPPSFVNWTTPELVISENAGEVNTELVRTGSLDRTFPVYIACDPNIRAKKDEPFSPIMGNMLPGAARFPVTLYPYNDGVFRGDLRKQVTVYGDLIASEIGTVTIGDYQINQPLEVYIVEDEPGPRVSIAPVETDEGDDFTPRTIAIPITVSQPLGKELVLRSQDSAVQGSIPKGATEGSLRFTYQPDRSREGDRAFTVPLIALGPNGTVPPAVTFGGPPEAIVRIHDDDPYRLAAASRFAQARSPFTLTIAQGGAQPVPLVAELSSSAPDVVAVPPRMGVPLSGDLSFQAQALRVGAAVITARFPDGQTAAVKIDVVDQPSMASVTPSTGLAGQIIRIDGENLSTDCRITFGGVPAKTLTFRDGALFATVPENWPRLVDVTAQCPGGSTRLPDAFRTLHRRRSVTP